MLNQHVDQIAEPRWTPLRLFIEPHVGIRRRAVVSFVRRCRWKFTVGFPPPSAGGSSSRGRKHL